MGILHDRHHEIFAQALAFGFTPTAAAVEAKLHVSAVEASMLSTDPQVKMRVQEILATEQYDSRESFRIARALEQDRDFAYAMGNPAAAINATVQRAKLLGLFVERTQNDNFVAVASVSELTPDEWAQRFVPGSVHTPAAEDTE